MEGECIYSLNKLTMEYREITAVYIAKKERICFTLGSEYHVTK